MLARLGIFATIFIPAIGLWFGGSYFTIAKWLFFLSGLLIVEAIMFRYLSRFNIKIGNAKEAELIKGDDTYNHEFICVPISLRFDLWEIKGISFVVYSDDKHINSEFLNKRGISLEKIDGTCTLDWRIRRGFASLAFLSGQQLFIGNPIFNVSLPQNESYLIMLKVWHSDTLINSSSYLITIVEGKMVLSDSKDGVPAKRLPLE